jgi:hypothetical protein
MATKKTNSSDMNNATGFDTLLEGMEATAMYKGAPVLGIAQIAGLIAECGREKTYMIQGENGIGKTGAVRQIAAMPEFQDYLFSVIDCTELEMGDHTIPVPDLERGVVRPLPNERYGVYPGSTRPVFLFFDEYAKAPRHIQQAISPTVYEHRVGSTQLPDGSIVALATNLAVEGLGDAMQAHSRTRLTTLTMRKPTANEWCGWARTVGLAPSLPAFVEQHPYLMDSFIDYAPGGKFASQCEAQKGGKHNKYIYNPSDATQEAYVSPRTLAKASPAIVKFVEGRISSMQLIADLCGTIGVNGASLLASYVRFEVDLPAWALIRKDPKNAPVPLDNPGALVVLSNRLMNDVVNADDADAAVTYLERMPNEYQSSFVKSLLTVPSKLPRFTRNSKFLEMMKKHSFVMGGV